MVLLKSGIRKYKSNFFTFVFTVIVCLVVTASAYAEGKVYLISIEGMHCKMCVSRVTKSLKKLKEVREVEVDLDDGTATVLLNDGADLKPEALEEAVSDSGYTPKEVKELK